MRILVIAALCLSGCAVTHKVELPDAPRSTGSAPVNVQDSRLDTTLRIQSIAGTGGGFLLFESNPSIASALADRVKASYRGQAALQIGIERLELFGKIGFMAPDDMTCGVESTLTAGGGATTTVRTRIRNNENVSPVVSTMARTLIAQCLDTHAKDLVAATSQ